VLQKLFMFTRREWLTASAATAACAMAASSPRLFGQNLGTAGRAGTTSFLSASPVSKLLAMLQRETNSDQVMQDVRTIWETDRWFTFPKFEETARSVAAIMRRSGLEEVEIGNGPADGVTQSGFWTMPLAWDISVGTLEIVDLHVPADMRLLADYQRVPTSIGMWSGPTPKGGVTTDVVLVSGNWTSANLKGKLVLGPPLGSKRALAQAGALGLISEHTENRALLDERGWVNSFGDNGWSFTKGSAPLVCFSITPRQSDLLRELLSKGPVKVRANVDSRYYSGVYPYVTGVIRGTDGASAEEVLSLGHLFEQGANDNATGVSSIIGAAGTLQRLIAEGKLPRPKRTIRVLGMSECYGMLHYLEQNKDRAKRTVAAMCIDAPAGQQTLAGTEYTWVLNPQSATSYVDSFILRVAAEYFPSVGRPWTWSEHRSGTDNYLGDPTIGIPTVLPRGGYGIHSHHNSHDTPALVDPKSLHNLTVMNATYAYFIASAGPAEKRWMAEVAMTNGYERVAAATETILDQVAAAEAADRLGKLLYQSREKIDYSTSRAAQAVHSAGAEGEWMSGFTSFSDQQKKRVELAIEKRASALGLGRIQPAVPKPIAEAEKIVVRRKRMGTITLDDLPQNEREGYPAASFWSVPVAALYWCDGKRNLAEVIRLTELEMGTQEFDFVGYFKFLSKHGYVDFAG
jgi:hypothetical protein